MTPDRRGSRAGLIFYWCFRAGQPRQERREPVEPAPFVAFQRVLKRMSLQYSFAAAAREGIGRGMMSLLPFVLIPR